MAMSEPKKRRKEAVESYDRRHLVSALLGLCGNVDLYKTQITLTPLKIKNCNATASSGASFSKAFCDTEPYNKGIVFGDVFHTGIKILRNFAITKKLPEERQMCLAFKKLIDFINGGMYVHVSVAVPDHIFRFNLLLQNHWANFNQTWHKSSLDEGDSSLFK